MSKISTSKFDIYALARDASHYLLIPESVAKPKNISEISKLLETRFQNSKPMTFRSGGTSLSGQAISKNLLVDTRFGFKRIEILENGKRIRVEPGVTIREVNNRLKPYGYKFGPDPASEIACTIGGAIANNSSGMLCGTETNVYQTVESLIIVFSDGTIFNTADPNANSILKEIQPEIFNTLVNIKNTVDNNSNLAEKIRKHYRLKNTMGYGMNSFTDFNDITQILTHLIIGSEGTLAFIAEATFKTVPIKPFAASSLLIFPTISASNDALSSIIESGAAAIELLDSTSLAVSKRINTKLEILNSMDFNQQVGLLIEYQEDSIEKLNKTLEGAELNIEKHKLSARTPLTSEIKTRNELWHVRKGLYATVAGARRPGTTALLEDIAVPVPDLGETCESLIKLFNKFNYKDSVIFGHARDGNIHFMINEDFGKQENIEHYRDFTEEMVELVLSKDGTLKAEHGTGRVMAPFVRRQYGDELYQLMVRIKGSFDPRNILNPDVIISDDDELHLKNFKSSPEIDPVVNKCVECGFCEPGCPSRNLTLTPRQRIGLQRAIPVISKKIKNEIEKRYDYEVLDTCAAESICSLYCPIGIDTGELVRTQRSNNSFLWSHLAKNYDLGLRVVRNLLSMTMNTPLKWYWNFSHFKRGTRRHSYVNSSPDLIYLPSCMNEFIGPSIQNTFEALCAKAGFNISIPEDIAGICCGTPWKSKGHKGKVNFEIDRKLPIVTDNSSCTYGFNAIDVNRFIIENMITKLNPMKTKRIVVHPTCSSEKIDENQYLIRLAELLAEEVIVPPNWSCCGFAGDRGFLKPELTKSATKDESGFVAKLDADYFVSSNKGCETAMTNSSKKPYRNILEVLLELSV